MSSELPARPNLEHLKKQAKDLLAAHQRGEAEALGRIRAALPSCANLRPAAIAALPFALHDAQSAIAREYGAASWAELRARVRAAQGAPQLPSTYQPPAMTVAGTAALSSEHQALLAEAQAKLRTGPVRLATPAQVPALPLRNSLVVPGTLAPLQMNRPTSFRAVEAAAEHTPPLLCILVQRKPEIDAPVRDDLHAVGCLCRLLARQPANSGLVSFLVEGLRWVALLALETTTPYYLVRIADFEIDSGEESAAQVALLDQKLRDRSKALAKAALPKDTCEQALALIDTTKDPARLSDLVLASLTCSPDEQAEYAERPELVQRLERVLELVEREFTLPSQTLAGQT